ncbi:Chemotaxis protein CheY [bioreactor metagenome]|uniref:Chemotaxis protein CheY n=1 Tax=bioreactor metagenome TaxID=1076179 RepID=A0A644ZX57_9ZZZZ
MGYRILIADDSLYARVNLKTILTEAGHEVVGEAGDGADAVGKYRSLSPDLVTMDITMPKLSGVEALEQIVGLDADAKIIMITAIGKPEKVLECLDMGAKHFITKPFDKAKVLAAIEHVMEGREPSES